MYPRDTAAPWQETQQPLAASSSRDAVPESVGSPRVLLWAGCASTLHRIRRGEGALLAINLSLVLVLGVSPEQGVTAALVSVLGLVLMYALNDLWDAPADLHNPKKDRFLVAAYLAHPRVSLVGIGGLSLLTIGLAWAVLGPRAAGFVAAVMLVNLVYSAVLKGVPVVDVGWCGLWGGLYAAIVTDSTPLIACVALMTAVCHLYQTLDDRSSDARNGIVTTAVRSPVLSLAVLTALSGLLVVALHGLLGPLWALGGLAPLLCFFVGGSPGRAWLLTKGCFGVVWLALLGLARAAA